MKLSFNDYVNSLRIEEAKVPLKNRDKSNNTIESIGEIVGFNTKSQFYIAFKKITDVTPSKYL